ncbi:TetR/AcrR family transcriptional regulator [Bradyrhizobium sp. NBAIM02]|uniref:TetR/AcrR family transcriptional regulator n=1 Tax=Bradyrhizobium sp. NBAIM02 TaxID=2793817 RepID=UPI001CD6C4BE|nr:TetR/AcrR family transcriptional regulator [Bradyrhizobium sp. NBAIM02]MCA1508654.1 TetR/AcrR family transcriptional regulator [Bradyrhizobium sp. NBAIM02]
MRVRLDPRFQRSRQSIITTVAELVDAFPIGEITITQVVEEAGVTRPTFYQHFADIPAAVRAAALIRLASALPKPEAAVPPEQVTAKYFRSRIIARMTPVLRHLSANKVFYLRVLESAANFSFFDEIVTMLTNVMLREPLERAARATGSSGSDVSTVIAGGMMWLTIEWLRTEPLTDVKVQASRIAANVLILAGFQTVSDPRKT